MPLSKSPTRRHVGRWTLLGVIFAIGSCAYYVRNHTGQNGMSFDQARWIAFEQDERGYSTRYSMVGDLLRRHQLIGMTRREVEELLGPATQESPTLGHPTLRWDLGLDPGFGNTDTTALLLHFGQDGRAVEVWYPGK